MGLVKSRRLPDETLPPPAVDVDVLLARLGDPVATERRKAAFALAVLPDTGLALCDRLVIETDDAVREAILTALMKQPSPLVVERLVSCLASDHAALRNGVLAVLRTIPHLVGGHIDRLLADADPDVRLMTVSLVSGLADPRAPEWLARVAADDLDVNVCANALEGLAEIGGPEAEPAILAAKTRFAGEPFLTFVADTVLARIGRR